MFRITAFAGALLCLLMTGVIPALPKPASRHTTEFVTATVAGELLPAKS